MDLIYPRSAERANQNALRKFPFSDGASCENGACMIPPGAIVDAQLYVTGDASTAWLSRIRADGVLEFSAGGAVIVTETPAEGDAAVTLRTSDGTYAGTVAFGGQDSVSMLLSQGEQEFDESQSQLAAAAVTAMPPSGVTGFRLTDGTVVSGDVRLRGEGGCTVESYVDADGRPCLRFSVTGEDSRSEDTLIRHVVVESNNRFFVTRNSETSEFVVELYGTGAAATTDNDETIDQGDVCATAKEKRGTWTGSSSADNDVCDTDPDSLTELTLYTEDPATGELHVDDTMHVAADETPRNTTIPGNRTMTVDGVTGEYRFTGYFDRKMGERDSVMYFDASGRSVDAIPVTDRLSLYSHWMAATSRATVDFVDQDGNPAGYTTLHIIAPSGDSYTNPVMIAGMDRMDTVTRPIPRIPWADGGGELIADMVANPVVPGEGITISIRGIDGITDR